jgi:hypothetical protein
MISSVPGASLPSQCVRRTVPSAIGGTGAGVVEIADLLPHLRGVVVERVECFGGVEHHADVLEGSAAAANR